MQYKDRLSEQQTTQYDDLFLITDEMREEIRTQFSGLSKHGAARGIAMWLLDEYGRNMKYDVTANLSPIEAYEQRRGNCLSFTMLLVALAKELDINIQFNSVDIPDSWDMTDGVGMVYFRHVNGVLSYLGRKQVFDLAMEVYDARYPQEYVTQSQVVAMYLNNQAISHLEEGGLDDALHAIKYAISIDPENPDLWVNLGVVKKRQGNSTKAEIAFLKAYDLSRLSVVSASNLERLYREQGRTREATQFSRKAEQARMSNPYIHYTRALTFYKEEKFKLAQRSTNKAIRLYGEDPRFFELKSLIAQEMGDYRKALLALEKAYINSVNQQQRGKYMGKAEMVAKTAQREYEEKTKGKTKEIEFEVQATYDFPGVL